jgi:radical SAM/SPASM domain protein of ACGX system
VDKYFSFQWHITDNCDQCCEHCYIFSKDNNIPLVEMSWDNMLSVLKNCEDMCNKLNRIPYFYITGGDPILHNNFWQLLELLKIKSIDFSIMGNPFHLTDEVCKRLKEYGCERYQLSIDGLQETHDQIRKKGSFSTTLEKIDCINKSGIRSVIMTTVSGTNITQIPDIIDLAVSHQVKIFAFARYCPTCFDTTSNINSKEQHIDPAQYRQLLEKCWLRFEQYKDSDTRFNLKDHLWKLYLYEKGLFTIPDGLDEKIIYDGCNCGISHLTIIPNGDIYACRRMDSIVGNVFTDNLADVFLSEKMDKYRSYEVFEKCSKCELLRFCRGCPAVAYGYTQNPYSADPQCWKAIA